MSDRHKYVILNDTDAPQPNMVCQWVEGIGYCYLDRTHNKPDFDGMTGSEATPVTTFGIQWIETDGEVDFWVMGRSFARYTDGIPRKWQSSAPNFSWPILTSCNVRRRKVAA